MTNLLHRSDKLFTVYSEYSKPPRTTDDFRTKVAKCIEVDGGIFEHLFEM
jgi:hypothetical protein